MTPLLAVLVLLAASGGPGRPTSPEYGGDHLPRQQGLWELHGQALQLDEGRLVLGEVVLAERAVGLPAVHRDWLAFAHGEPGDTELVLMRWEGQGWSSPQVIADEGSPDRVAISPDGRWLVWVQGPIAGLWLLDLEMGVRRQLTNDGPPTPAGPPEGWLPVPHRHAPHFEGDELVWLAPDGIHRLEIE